MKSHIKQSLTDFLKFTGQKYLQKSTHLRDLWIYSWSLTYSAFASDRLQIAFLKLSKVKRTLDFLITSGGAEGN